MGQIYSKICALDMYEGPNLEICMILENMWWILFVQNYEINQTNAEYYKHIDSKINRCLISCTDAPRTRYGKCNIQAVRLAANQNFYRLFCFEIWFFCKLIFIWDSFTDKVHIFQANISYRMFLSLAPP